jgi:hypothetical protein
MSQAEIKVGIIGAGDIVCNRHLPNLRKIEGVEIVAVCNRTSESAERVAADYDIPRIYKNWRDLIRQKDVDAVFIGTPPLPSLRRDPGSAGCGKTCILPSAYGDELSGGEADVRSFAENSSEDNAVSCPRWDSRGCDDEKAD